MPRVAQTGAVVALILGFSCSLLLRSNEGDGTFRIVAECYVQGVMQGEVFQLGKGNRHMENILIS